MCVAVPLGGIATVKCDWRLPPLSCTGVVGADCETPLVPSACEFDAAAAGKGENAGVAGEAADPGSDEVAISAGGRSIEIVMGDDCEPLLAVSVSAREESPAATEFDFPKFFNLETKSGETASKKVRHTPYKRSPLAIVHAK